MVIKDFETKYSNILEFIPLGSSLFVFFDRDIFLNGWEKKLKFPHFAK